MVSACVRWSNKCVFKVRMVKKVRASKVRMVEKELISLTVQKSTALKAIAFAYSKLECTN